MIKKIKIFLLSLVALVTLGAPVLMPAVAFGAPDIQGGLCSGANFDASLPAAGTACDTAQQTAATNKVNDIIKLVINILSVLVGVIAVIMIIVGGLKYILSAGDSGNVTSAKNTILYAIVGLVIVALAQFVVRFVLAKVNPT